MQLAVTIGYQPVLYAAWYMLPHSGCVAVFKPTPLLDREGASRLMLSTLHFWL